jgi:predicted Fe-Mo cluster-binding NifX family protein
MSGYEIARQAVWREPRQTVVATWMIAGVLVSMFVPLAFSRFELRVARRVNSPSLAADAQEYRMHVFSSGVVLVALIGARSGIPLDRAAAVIVVGIVFKTGWTLLRDGMRMLLDASLDDDTLAAVHTIIETEPTVVSIKALRGRNAGRFRFLEAEIGLRTTDLERARQIGQSLELAIRTRVPHVERVLMHLEPAQKPVLRVAVSLSGAEGSVSLHFGTAPYFALADVRLQDGVCLRQNIVSNPYHLEAARRGLDVAKWLVAEEVDVVITGDDVRDKTPGYVLSNAGVAVVVTRAADLATALEEWLTDRGITRSTETLHTACAE